MTETAAAGAPAPGMTVTEAYARELAERGITLPLEASGEEMGIIVDSEGRTVLIVDDLPDAHVRDVTALFVSAINAAAGFAPPPAGEEAP